jgi:hypothetical protein
MSQIRQHIPPLSLFLAGTNRFEVTLEKSNKNFSKKIQQVGG